LNVCDGDMDVAYETEIQGRIFSFEKDFCFFWSFKRKWTRMRSYL